MPSPPARRDVNGLRAPACTRLSTRGAPAINHARAFFFFFPCKAAPARAKQKCNEATRAFAGPWAHVLPPLTKVHFPSRRFRHCESHAV